MKRIVYTLGLALGVSVASYAGVITSASGNLTGGGQTTINFEDGTAFPLGSFSSLPFNFAGNAVTIQTTIAATSCGAGANCASYSTGTNAAIATGATGYSASLFSKYITTYGGTGGGAFSFSGGISQSTNFTKTLTFTFANSISDFIISYFGSDGAITPGGAYLSTANRVTFGSGAGSVIANLANQKCTNGVDCNSTPGGSGNIGYAGDLALASFNVVTFTFDGADQGSSLNGDQVLFDNLRVFNLAGGTVTTTTTTTTVPPGAIPEPSTYALIGAGLVGMAFARRKK